MRLLLRGYFRSLEGKKKKKVGGSISRLNEALLHSAFLMHLLCLITKIPRKRLQVLCIYIYRVSISNGGFAWLVHIKRWKKMFLSRLREEEKVDVVDHICCCRWLIVLCTPFLFRSGDDTHGFYEQHAAHAAPDAGAPGSRRATDRGPKRHLATRHPHTGPDEPCGGGSSGSSRGATATVNSIRKYKQAMHTHV